MAFEVKNLEWLRQLAPQSFEDLHQIGPRLYSALLSIQKGVGNIEMQTNSNANGAPGAPPKISGLTVAAQNGHFQVAIADHNEIYRGIQYFVEHADNPNFVNAVQTQASGTSKRNHNEYLGATDRYWRAYSAYPGGPPSEPVYFGGATPTLVQGGGSAGGPAFLASQGSGTGAAGVGLVGNGTTQYRTNTGAPPVRNNS